ncbi:hypothetical protein CSPX01_10076 [Colletotrichum filicis]|nr:hypothetical protein CSPX01_10076 [Colletotrichum filicis]
MKHNTTMALVWQSHRAWACRTNPTPPPPSNWSDWHHWTLRLGVWGSGHQSICCSSRKRSENDGRDGRTPDTGSLSASRRAGRSCITARPHPVLHCSRHPMNLAFCRVAPSPHSHVAGWLRKCLTMLSTSILCPHQNGTCTDELGTSSPVQNRAFHELR